MDKKDLQLIATMLILLITILAAFTLGPSEEKYNSILEAEGFSDIEYHGYTFFGCQSGDLFKEKFSGQKEGKRIEGVLCSGMTKGITIRYF